MWHYDKKESYYLVKINGNKKSKRYFEAEFRIYEKRIQRQMQFNRDISLLSSEFRAIYENEVTDGFDDIPMYVMERYADYMFAEFEKQNFTPMNAFFDFCEKNIDDSICELIGITLGESLTYIFTDRIYIDYVEKTAGTETKKCLGMFLFKSK